MSERTAPAPNNLCVRGLMRTRTTTEVKSTGFLMDLSIGRHRKFQAQCMRMLRGSKCRCSGVIPHKGDKEGGNHHFVNPPPERSSSPRATEGTAPPGVRKLLCPQRPTNGAALGPRRIRKKLSVRGRGGGGGAGAGTPPSCPTKGGGTTPFTPSQIFWIPPPLFFIHHSNFMAHMAHRPQISQTPAGRMLQTSATTARVYAHIRV